MKKPRETQNESNLRGETPDTSQPEIDHSSPSTLSIKVSGHHIKITQGLEEAVKTKAMHFLSKVKHAQHLNAIISMEKHTVTIHLLLKLHHETLSVIDEDPDAYAAIHKALCKLKQLVNKHLDKQINSKRKRQSKSYVDSDIENHIPYEEIEKLHHHEQKTIPILHSKAKNISKRKMNVKTLSEKEAIKELEQSSDMILLFLGQEDHKFKLIYEKDHGNYDVIEIGDGDY